MIELSICFGTYQRRAMLENCVASCRLAAGNLTHEFCICDGGSKDGTLEYLRAQKDVKLVEHGEQRGAVQAYYDVLSMASGEYVCYLSDDLIVPAGMFQAAVEYLKENLQCGVVSLPYKNPTQSVEKLVYTTVGGKRLPFASFGVLRRQDGIRVDWMPRVTYHYYLDVGVCLAIQGLGLTVEALPGDYVIQHLMADNLDRGEERSPSYSSNRDAKAFHEYWSERV